MCPADAGAAGATSPVDSGLVNDRLPMVWVLHTAGCEERSRIGSTGCVRCVRQCIVKNAVWLATMLNDIMISDHT